jgi:hypothetical protein
MLLSLSCLVSIGALGDRYIRNFTALMRNRKAVRPSLSAKTSYAAMPMAAMQAPSFIRAILFPIHPEK